MDMNDKLIEGLKKRIEYLETKVKTLERLIDVIAKISTDALEKTS